MNATISLAVARVKVADVVRRLIPRLNAADQHAAVSVLLNSVADVAADIAREQEAAAQAQARIHDFGRSA